LTPLAGKLSATFPLRWIYITFFSIFMVGSLICGFAPNSNSFIVGRAVAGIGASGVASGGFVIVLTVASDKAKPLLMGICSSCFAMGLILAPVIGGAFTQKATWRWCFWVNLPPGAVTLVAMLLFFKPPSIQRDRTPLQRIKNLDLVGCAIFIPAIFMLLLAMMWGGTEKPWGSATIIGLFVGSGVTLMLFVGWEHYKGDGAMIPGNLIVRRTITFSVLFSFCHFGSLGILNYYLPEWFQAVEGASPLESGTRVLASVLAQIVGTLSSGILGKLNTRISRGRYQRLILDSAESQFLQPLALHWTSLHVHRRSVIHPVHGFQYTIQPLDRVPSHPGSRGRHGPANALSHSPTSSP
jgi:MFS family permease